VPQAPSVINVPPASHSRRRLTRPPVCAPGYCSRFRTSALRYVGCSRAASTSKCSTPSRLECLSVLQERVRLARDSQATADLYHDCRGSRSLGPAISTSLLRRQRPELASGSAADATSSATSSQLAK